MNTDNKKQIQNTIKVLLDKESSIIFAYIFGSFITGNNFRDIDIGIYAEPRPDLLFLGRMQSRLNQKLPSDTDLVLLNDIPTTKPAFAYEICSKGQLVSNKDSERHTAYKTKVFSYYFDTAYLREQIDRAFHDSLESGRFGVINYE